jgi:hypothetical protein
MGALPSAILVAQQDNLGAQALARDALNAVHALAQLQMNSLYKKVTCVSGNLHLYRRVPELIARVAAIQMLTAVFSLSTL